MLAITSIVTAEPRSLQSKAEHCATTNLMSGRGGLHFPRNQDTLDDSLDARYRHIVGLTGGRRRERERDRKREGTGAAIVRMICLAEWFFSKGNLENLSIVVYD